MCAQRRSLRLERWFDISVAFSLVEDRVGWLLKGKMMSRWTSVILTFGIRSSFLKGEVLQVRCMLTGCIAARSWTQIGRMAFGPSVRVSGLAPLALSFRATAAFNFLTPLPLLNFHVFFGTSLIIFFHERKQRLIKEILVPNVILPNEGTFVKIALLFLLLNLYFKYSSGCNDWTPPYSLLWVTRPDIWGRHRPTWLHEKDKLSCAIPQPRTRIFPA